MSSKITNWLAQQPWGIDSLKQKQHTVVKDPATREPRDENFFYPLLHMHAPKTLLCDNVWNPNQRIPITSKFQVGKNLDGSETNDSQAWIFTASILKARAMKQVKSAGPGIGRESGSNPRSAMKLTRWSWATFSPSPSTLPHRITVRPAPRPSCLGGPSATRFLLGLWAAATSIFQH